MAQKLTPDQQEAIIHKVRVLFEDRVGVVCVHGGGGIGKETHAWDLGGKAAGRGEGQQSGAAHVFLPFAKSRRLEEGLTSKLCVVLASMRAIWHGDATPAWPASSGARGLPPHHSSRPGIGMF